MMKKLLKLVLGLLLLFVIYIVVTLIHGTLTDYQPPLETELRLEQSSGQLVIQDSILSFAIWNLGYAGLGKESDFFFSDGSSLLSGGRMVRSSEELVEKNLAGIEQFLKGTRSDFFMLQEVDYDSKRSYGHNQFALAQESLPAYAAAKATNYQVKRVPLPVLEPWNVYGKVWGGLATLGRYQPLESKRLQLPGEYAWPTRIFQLDRCILYQQYAVKDDRKLTLLNVHNSAYDGGV
ncbi:MAG: endonuclease/exonuclease/phosphatase family protein, partial [Bacteroidota bacterium]